MRYDTVIFDFDGTVADTGRGVKNSVKYALDKFGIPVGDESRLDYFIGPPLYVGFEDVYGVDRDMSSRLVEAYREYYSETGVFELDPYLGMTELIGELKAAGVKLAVASSKPQHFLDKALKIINAYDLFSFVVGPELGNHNADKSSLINTALAKLEKKPSADVVMVGDRFYDIEGAKSVGISSIGVTFGYGGRDELEKAGALELADSAKALREILFS